MSKIAILTDSNSGISMKKAKAYGVNVIPMPFNINGVEFKNPVIAASGTFGFGAEYNNFYDVGILGDLDLDRFPLDYKLDEPIKTQITVSEVEEEERVNLEEITPKEPSKEMKL